MKLAAPNETQKVALSAFVALQVVPAAPFEALDRQIREGVYGHVDSLFVIRDGRTVADYTSTHDYRAIGRGRSGPIGPIGMSSRSSRPGTSSANAPRTSSAHSSTR